MNSEEFFNNHHLVVETERAMLENAEKTHVPADSSKFGHREMIHECSITEIDAIITEALPEGQGEIPPKDKIILVGKS